jgi:hypothetical protein
LNINFISGCEAEYTDEKCIFPFHYDNRSLEACYLDTTDRYSKIYKCPTAFYENGEPQFKDCSPLCPVECERDITYHCNGDCIPFNKPCNGKCLGKDTRNG